MTAKVLILVLWLCAIVSGQLKPALNCAVSNDNRKVVVVNGEGLTLADINKPAYWLLYKHSTSTKDQTRLEIIAVETNASENLVKLTLNELLPNDVDNISGELAAVKNVIPITTCAIAIPGKVQVQNEFKAAKGKADSDIYFNGSYTTTAGGDPIYSIDAFAGYMHRVGPKDDPWGKLGVYGQVKTKSSTNPSPNSYLAYADFQRVLGDRLTWFGPFQMP
jgi:hypothetical protein